MLSHTPFKELVPRLGNLPVLIAGRHPQIEEVAKSYGFRKTVTTAQLAAAHPSAVPFAGTNPLTDPLCLSMPRIVKYNRGDFVSF